MGSETVESTNGNITSVTRNTMGARGMDMMVKASTSGMVTVFPVYDAHGNMTASISRNGLGFSIGDERSYDAWGAVRQGASTGDPKNRYCANLGHVADDESGLIYMRARYYEPSSGRFVSQDSARDGGNWYVYTANNPVNLVDENGKETVSQAFTIGLISTFMAGVSYLIVTGALGSSISPGEIWDRAFAWLIGAGVVSTYYKWGGETKGVKLTAESFMRKLRFGVYNGLVGGGAVGAIMGLHLGQHAGRIMLELYEMQQMDSWGPDGGVFFCQ
jgi:RHS repeat-associated protein